MSGMIQMTDDIKELQRDRKILLTAIIRVDERIEKIEEVCVLLAQGLNDDAIDLIRNAAEDAMANVTVPPREAPPEGMAYDNEAHLGHGSMTEDEATEATS